MRKKWWALVVLTAVVGVLAGCTSNSIWEAAQKGDQGHAGWVLFWEPEMIDELDPQTQWTPLQHAIENSYGDMVAKLLAKGADPDVKSGDGRTAWDFANEVPNDIMRSFILDSMRQTVAKRQADAQSETVATADPS